MLLRNPRRTGPTSRPPESVSAVAQRVTPTVVDLQKALNQALGRIEQLEARLSRLELGVFVADNGDVEIYGSSNVRIGSGSRVQLEAPLRLEMQAAGGSVALHQGKVEVAGSEHVVAAGSVKVDSGSAHFTGQVKADSVVARSVVGQTYTPGAGNIW
jgi:hypothetical protein